MVQLVIDISSEKDASLIQELLKRFKGVEVNNFKPTITVTKARKRIEQGIAEADNGTVKEWKEVKAGVLKQIRAKSK